MEQQAIQLFENTQVRMVWNEQEESNYCVLFNPSPRPKQNLSSNGWQKWAAKILTDDKSTKTE